MITLSSAIYYYFFYIEYTLQHLQNRADTSRVDTIDMFMLIDCVK